MSTTKQEYLDLVKKAAYYSDLYYNQDSPAISDYDYDQLTQRIKAMEKEHPEWVTEASPTQHVGGKAVLGKGVPHAVHLLSLNDVFSYEDVEAWYQTMNMPATSVQQKIDGLTIALTYEDGKLTIGATRGDGFTGEDVTANAKVIDGIPKELPIPANAGVHAHNRLLVRAEVYQPVSAFERVNRELEESGKKTFANPRNCAAGSLRVLDPKITASRELSAIAFAVLAAEGWDDVDEAILPKPGVSETQDLALLAKLGFHAVPAYPCNGMEEILSAIEKIGGNRDGLPYWIDGAVIKTDDKKLQAMAGNTAKYPKHAVAYKYPPERKETVIREIVVQTGRTGVLTPVAVFDPVQLCGTTVSRATLHNQGFIDMKGIGVGATIEVYKSGEIIPRVDHVVKPGDNPIFKIERCPVCGAVAVAFTDENGTDTGVVGCPNKSCPAQYAGHLQFFCSKDVMDIDGLGPAVIDKLIDAGLLNSVTDIYHLKEHENEIADMPGLGKKSCAAMFAAIEDSKNRDLDRFIKSLGIPGVGRHIGKALGKKYPDIWAVASASAEELALIDGVGSISAEVIVDFFKREENIQLIKELEALGLNVKSMEFGKAEGDKALKGLTFVITGTLPDMSRDEAKALIEQNGGKCSGSVSKKTSYLLAGEAAGSKLTKANELGVPVIDTTQLYAMLHK